ncbi:MAG: xylulokinase [Streptosporangiaceae bacterium]
MPEIVVTLDIGGSGVKASCFDVSGDVVTTAASVPYPPGTGHDDGTFDPDVWADTATAALAQIVARCPAQPHQYLGITVSAIRIPFVLLDSDQRVVGPSLLNRDRRALPIVDDLVATIGHRALHRTTGHWAAPEFGLPKLLWIQRNHPDAWPRVRTVIQLHDWFVFRLCGAIASEASSAAMSQVMDISAGTWAYDLLAAECGIGPEMLPEFAAAGTRAGGLLRAVAEQVGLPAGLPVHLGGGDTHMSALAAGGQASGGPVVVAGTTGPVQVAVRSPLSLDAWFPLLVSPLPGRTGWALESNTGPTGEIVDRLRDLSQLSGPGLGAALLARGFHVDDAVSHSDGLTILAGNPFFGPTGWQVWPAPTIFGLTPRHTGADLLAAARTGTCLAFSEVLDQLSGASRSRTDTVIATGGMSRSAAWSQTLADVTGRSVLVRELDHVSGLAGAALVTGVSAESFFRDLEATRYTPDASRRADLERSVEAYCRLYAASQARSQEYPLPVSPRPANPRRDEVDVHASPH